MTPFLQQLFSGIALGGVYASVAIALVMIYKATGHVNFALGETALFSTFVGSSLIDRHYPYWIAFAIAVSLAFVIGVLIERLLIRRTEGQSPLTAVAVLIGLMLVFNSLAGWEFGFTVRRVPSPFPSKPLFGNGYLSSHEIGILGVTFAIVAVVYLVFEHTRLGLAMRGAADNSASSRLSGIRVGRMFAIGWGLSPAIAAIAGMMIAPLVTLETQMMSGVMLYGLAAALLGGIDSPAGAILGGFLIGVVENLAGMYVVDSELKMPVALAIIVGVLMLRPTGLFGQRVVTRV